MSVNSAEPSSHAVTIVRLSTNDRYELREGGKTIGYTRYRMSDDDTRVIFTYTDLGDEYTGRGLAERLAQFALEDVRSRGKRIVADCPIIAAYMRLHPEYKDTRDPAPGSTGSTT